MTRRMGATSMRDREVLHPEGMQRRVADEGATMGVAFDGDADRAIFASASGKLVDGDGVLLAAGRYLKAHKQLRGDTIVGTTMANLGLERALEKDGLKLTRTAVGDRYVLEEMLRTGANLGGAVWSHFVFGRCDNGRWDADGCEDRVDCGADGAAG